MVAFKRSCDLGAAIGCRNVAGQYRSGELGEKNTTLAETDERRDTELAGQGPK
jgi:hypothetical protein